MKVETSGLGLRVLIAKLTIHSGNDICLRLRGNGGSGGVQGRTGIAFHTLANTPVS